MKVVESDEVGHCSCIPVCITENTHSDCINLVLTCKFTQCKCRNVVTSVFHSQIQFWTTENRSTVGPCYISQNLNFLVQILSLSLLR